MKRHEWILSRGKRLSSMIHVPDQGRILAVAVMCHGFTGDKVGGNQLWRGLAEALESAGLAAVRFDFAGSGDSEGVFAEDTTVTGWLQDAAAVRAWVCRQSEFAGLPLVMVGHSLGGYLVCHPDLQVEAVRLRVALAPVTDPVPNFRETILGPTNWDALGQGKPIKNFYGKGFSLNPSFAQDLVGQPKLSETPVPSAPTLFVHGDEDVAVPISGTLCLQGVWGQNVELEVLSGADHGFTDHRPAMYSIVTQWLCNRLMNASLV